jgi:hypothetical protein
MRSAREIQFRLRQEAANSLLALSSPKRVLHADTPLEGLPDPSAVASGLRDTDYARNLVATADEILRGHIPLFDGVATRTAVSKHRQATSAGFRTSTSLLPAITSSFGKSTVTSILS